MLKLLIPIFDRNGAPEAARHGAFLFSERCVSEVEVVEVLGEVEYDRSSAFRTVAVPSLKSPRPMQDAVRRTRAILDDAKVPYTWTCAFGRPARTIADCAHRSRADIVLLDTSGLGAFRKVGVLFGLRRLTRTPVLVLQ